MSVRSHVPWTSAWAGSEEAEPGDATELVAGGAGSGGDALDYARPKANDRIRSD